MAEARPQVAGFTTLEITVPTDGTDHIVALTGIANAYGLPIRERQTLSSDLDRSDMPAGAIVHHDDLRAISVEVFNTPDYGDTAQTLLDTERRAVAKEAIGRHTYPRESDHRQVVRLSSYNYGPLLHPDDKWDPELITVTSPNDYESEQTGLEQAFTRLWPQTSHPFAAPKVVGRQGLDNELEWSAKVDTVTRDRLAHFLRSERLHRRELVGAVGKAVDVLGIRSGLVGQSEATDKWATEPERPFVSHLDFRLALLTSELSGNAQRVIRERISGLLRNMVIIGQYRNTSAPQMIVEGNARFELHNDLLAVQFDRIAVESLERVFDGTSKSKNKSPRAFLKSYLSGVAATSDRDTKQV